MRKCRREINAEIINDEVEGSSSIVEDIKIRKCSIKGHFDIINKEIKGSSSEEE